MVNLKYVEKRKRNKIVSIAAAAGSVVVLAFGIISFLGQRTGSFTVNLKRNNVQIALSTTSDFKNQTSFLRADQVENLELYCFQNFKNPDTGEIDFSQIDNEETDYKIGARIDSDNGEVRGLKFFKYTFFVKNIGSSPAHYEFDVNINSDTRDKETSKQISTFLRCCIIENGIYTVYAKRSNDATHYDTDYNDTTTLEYIDCDHEKESKYEGLAEPFISNTKVCSRTFNNFNGGNVNQYTLIFWLEGDDAEAFGIAPKDCKLKLGVEIQAYEN